MSSSRESNKKRRTNSAPKTSYIKSEDVAPEYQKIHQEFIDSVDDDLVDYAKSVKNGTAGKKPHKICGVKRAEADRIREITGADVDGYEHVIGKNDICGRKAGRSACNYRIYE